MKAKSLIIIIFISLIFSTIAESHDKKPPKDHPKKKSDSLSLVFEGGNLFLSKPASGPLVDPGWGFGYGGGVAIDFGYMQYRLDVHYVKWVKNGQTYWRMPFFMGYRIFPLRKSNIFLPYIEMGFELSGDKKLFGEADVHAGFTPGAGMELRIFSFIMGVNVRYHIIKHPYLSIGPYAGIRF